MRRVAHVSDLHFGRTDPAAVEGLATDLQQQRVHLVVVSGDLTQRARRWQFEEIPDLYPLPLPVSGRQRRHIQVRV